MPRRSLASALAVALAIACKDGGPPPPKPTAVEIVAGASQTGTAGLAVPTPPSFVVKDQNGRAMGGVAVTIAVTAGGGSLSGAPTRTADGGPTSVGTWVLGPRVGENRLRITVAGLPPASVTIVSAPGAPAKMVAQTSTTLQGIVGESVTPAPIALVTDAFDNPVPTATVTVALTGGGSAPGSLSTSAEGLASVASWTLGTVKGTNTLTMSAGTATLAFTTTAAPGPPTSLAVVSGNGQVGPAGVNLSLPIRLRVADRFGNGIPGQVVSFELVAGGGSLAAATASSDDDGGVAAPGWRLGRSAVSQAARASLGPLSADLTAVVQTSYRIDVRFFGSAMSVEHQALFTAAAARLSAILTGDVIDVQATNFDLQTYCGVPGAPPLNEIIDDVVIYASVRAIDGPGKILAQAGSCAFRSQAYGYLPAIGIMQFDVDDLATLAGQGGLQDVIIHEMLHVLGIGRPLWETHRFLVDAGTPTVAYSGPQARQGCINFGGTVTCANTVPVENTGGVGTADSHWRESVFDNELMTGYADRGSMPISLMTIGGLADLGYVVNRGAVDDYHIPGGALRSAGGIAHRDGWERELVLGRVILHPGGRVEVVRRPQ